MRLVNLGGKDLLLLGLAGIKDSSFLFFSFLARTATNSQPTTLRRRKGYRCTLLLIKLLLSVLSHSTLFCHQIYVLIRTTVALGELRIVAYLHATQPYTPINIVFPQPRCVSSSTAPSSSSRYRATAIALLSCCIMQ